MYWPALKLTKNEAERWSIYSEPGKVQRPAIYRAYAGELNITTTTPEDVESIQISRRARVFALTASGDVHNVAVQLYDSSGEQYTMGFVPLANLIMGSNDDPRGLATFINAGSDAATLTAAQFTALPKRLALGLMFGKAMSLAPHIFEPNIVLLPNQSMSIKGRALNPPTQLSKFNQANGAEVVREGAYSRQLCGARVGVLARVGAMAARATSPLELVVQLVIAGTVVYQVIQILQKPVVTTDGTRAAARK